MNFMPTDDEQLRVEVRNKYAKTALQVLSTSTSTEDTSAQSTTFEHKTVVLSELRTEKLIRGNRMTPCRVVWCAVEHGLISPI